MDLERVCVRERRKIVAAKSEMTSYVRVRSVLDESRRAVKHVESERARDFYAHMDICLTYCLAHSSGYPCDDACSAQAL